MKAITSKIHKKQRNASIVYGLFYLIMGIIPQFNEESSLVSWSYIFVGVVMLGTIGYQAYKGNYFSIIKWNDNILAFKSPESKFVQFKRSAIKSVKLTDKSLTINAGLGDGEMLDLDYFKTEDLEYFKKDFVEGALTETEAYNLAEA